MRELSAKTFVQIIFFKLLDYNVNPYFERKIKRFNFMLEMAKITSYNGDFEQEILC